MTEEQPFTGIRILDRIVARKRAEVEALSPRRPELELAAETAGSAVPVLPSLEAGRCVAVIAEVKRRSPAAGDIRPGLDPAEMAGSYRRGGAGALSVLTDASFFGGSLDDLRSVRASVSLPLLRKDFVIDELQVLEARAAGADIVLLINRILAPSRLAGLLEFVRTLGMTGLVEVHEPHEVATVLDAGARLVGINNRDLTTFETDLNVTERIRPLLPDGICVVSESGIRDPSDVEALSRLGVHAVLVGEALVRAWDPEAAVEALASVPRIG